MIYITGDTHQMTNFEKLKTFAIKNPHLTKNDYLIIAGDFGAVWSSKTLENDLLPYQELPFTILFIDGNHENFTLLNSYPVEMWHGGKVHKIKNDIIHLMRGQIFELEGKTIFTFGGATSIDKARREVGVSWWEEEVPSFDELDEAFVNLAKYHNKVDYIITHNCDEKPLYYKIINNGEHLYPTPDCQMLSNFEDMVDYGHWYFGHYHIDAKITDQKTAIFEQIIKL